MRDDASLLLHKLRLFCEVLSKHMTEPCKAPRGLFLSPSPLFARSFWWLLFMAPVQIGAGGMRSSSFSAVFLFFFFIYCFQESTLYYLI